MKKLLLWCACLLALASPLRAAGALFADIVVIRIVDYGNEAKIFITRGEGKTEEIEIKTKGMDYEKGMGAVGEGYYKVLTKLYQEGYVLQDSSTLSSGNGVGRVTYILVKNN